MRLSDASVICCVTYFQFPIQSAFLYYIARQVAPALQCTNGFNTLYQILNVEKNWVVTFLVRNAQSRGQTLN